MLVMKFNGTKYRLTIIIPVYNEEESLPNLEKELIDFLKEAIVPTEVLFIDDGSTDNSLKLIHEICNSDLDINYVSLNKNNGLSTALKVGFDHTNTNLVGYLDADLQTLPRDFNKLLIEIDSYEMATGVRTKREDSLIKTLSSKVANRIRRIFTNDGIEDTGCPLKIIKTEYAKRIPMFKGLHRFLPAMVKLQNGRILQVPIDHYPRLAGQSHFNILNRIFGTLIDCFIFLWIKKRYINYNVNKKSF